MSKKEQEDKIAIVAADLNVLKPALALYRVINEQECERAASMGMDGGVRGYENEIQRIDMLCRNLGINLRAVEKTEEEEEGD